MSVFNDLNLTWKGTEYTVPADNVLRLIAKVEDVITLTELYAYSQKGTAPLAKLASAFGIMLRYAGAKVQDDEVYTNIIGQPNAAMESVQTILSMMLPPANLIEGAETGKP